MKMRRVERSVREDGRTMKRTRKWGRRRQKKKDSGVNKKIKKKKKTHRKRK